MKNMIQVLPKGYCPKCGHAQFIVHENQTNVYLTNRDGEIIDYTEDNYNAIGKCINCGAEYEMLSGYNTFIPMTPLRKLLSDFSRSKLLNTNDKFDDIDNPFVKKE